MKTHPYNASHRSSRLRPRWFVGSGALLFAATLMALTHSGTLQAIGQQQQPAASNGQRQADDASPATAAAADAQAAAELALSQGQRERAADELVWQTIERLTHGGAFEAKLKQRVWAAGREVVGVGRYEQAGGRTGRVSMELMIPIAHGKCLMQQTCDGRLAWTREQVGDEVRLRRVDVGRLDELVPPDQRKASGSIAPGLRVGGLVELFERIHTDYRLRLVGGQLEGRAVWILRGAIRPETRQQILETAGRQDWPPLCPVEARVAIAAEDGPQDFGQGLPVRFEFWGQKASGEPSLISLLEVYDARAIEPAPQQHFRYETGGQDVDFTNDTERYLRRFGVRLTDSQRMMLWR